MEITRRSLLGASAAAGAGLLLPLRLKTAANAADRLCVTPFTEALPTLAEMGVIDATKGGTAKIRMVNATHSFHKAMRKTPTFAYRSNGGVQDYLGPVIVAKRNVPFKLTVVNELGVHPLAGAMDFGIDGAVPLDATAPRAAVHLHGGNTDPANDGDPLDFFGHGASKTYQYGNTQEAAGLWFHDHALGITRLNVFAGLAGGYLVRDANDPGDGTLLPAPPYEVPLVIQDRMFNADGTFDYPLGEDRNWAPEFFGDVATVNGKAWPNLAVDKGKYRFRVFNGSQARFYNFRFESGGSVLQFFQIGTDGGLLNRPVRLSSLLLAPGERADLVVDFAPLSAGAKVILTNDAAEPFPNGDPSGVPQIMQFTVTQARGWTKPLTILRDLRANTAPITRLAGLNVDKTRSISLVEVHDATTGDPTTVLMNNRNFLDPAGKITVKSNSLEQWEFINTTVDAHPMHVHFAQFQVLNRQSFDRDRYFAAAGYDDNAAGSGVFPPPAVGPYLTPGSTPRLPAANERGWKDTIVALPGEVTRIRVPFGPNAVPGSPMAIGKAYTGRYVSHCHILEHEENDMMMRYVIQ